ncbi:MAG TPA: hypothetical protein PK847_13165, partial [Candidatus Sumerlaeota bacterium]|nr:hypothetical protein [Candidatus Sumerlaeota bacterium]
MEPIIPLAAILMPVMLFAIAALGPLLLIALIVWVGFRVVRGGNRREESLNAQRAAQDELRALMSGM